MISFVQSIILSCSVMASMGLDSPALNAQALLKIGNQCVECWQQDFALVAQKLSEEKTQTRKSHKHCSSEDSRTVKRCRKSAHHHKKSKAHHRKKRSSQPAESQPRRLRRAPCPYIDRRRCR